MSSNLVHINNTGIGRQIGIEWLAGLQETVGACAPDCDYTPRLAPGIMYISGSEASSSLNRHALLEPQEEQVAWGDLAMAALALPSKRKPSHPGQSELLAAFRPTTLPVRVVKPVELRSGPRSHGSVGTLVLAVRDRYIPDSNDTTDRSGTFEIDQEIKAARAVLGLTPPERSRTIEIGLGLLQGDLSKLDMEPIYEYVHDEGPVPFLQLGGVINKVLDVQPLFVRGSLEHPPTSVA